MRDRTEVLPELRIFCQNVNRNYGYLDTLLASLYDKYDLLFIQELPWNFIRAAPSAHLVEGEAVIGAPISPNWGCIVRASTADSSTPRVAVYFDKRLARLRPSYRRDLIDHRDVIVFSLGLGDDVMLFANVYSDKRNTAIRLLWDQAAYWPGMRLMCGDFNVRHRSWDPTGPSSNTYADRLVEAAGMVGLARCLPEVKGPTHFPYDSDLTPTVIDLMFVRTEEVVTFRHRILARDRGPSDHAPLVISIPAPGMAVPASKWAIKSGSDEEGDFLAQVQMKLLPLYAWQGTTPREVEEVIHVISTAFADAWTSHAVESKVCARSKGW